MDISDELSRCFELLGYRLNGRTSEIQLAPGSQRRRRTDIDEFRDKARAWLNGSTSGIAREHALELSRNLPIDSVPRTIQDCRKSLAIVISLLVEWIDGLEIEPLVKVHLNYLEKSWLWSKLKLKPPFLWSQAYSGMAQECSRILEREKLARVERLRRAEYTAARRAEQKPKATDLPKSGGKIVPTTSNDISEGIRRRTFDDQGKDGHWW